jgi:nicotinamidase-related amidase
MQGLLVVDVQRDVMAACADAEAVVGRIAGLVERARAAGVPVTWVQHHDEEMEQGSEGWQIVPELVPAEGEPVVHKAYGDSFAETDLADRLSGQGVAELVLCGAQTDWCIRSTLHGALLRGYPVALVGDAHTTEDTVLDGEPLAARDLVRSLNHVARGASWPGAAARLVGAEELFGG